MEFIYKILISTALTVVLIQSQIVFANDLNYYALGLQAEISGDSQGAIEQYSIAANKGSSAAKFALGRLYRDIFADDISSFKWFKEAAEQGNVYAQYELGQIYRHGNPYIEANKDEAIKWFSNAAYGGKHGEAAYALFELSELDQDKLRWLQQSANQGIAQAMNQLGEAYNNGELGLQVDTSLAQDWFNQATAVQE